MWEPQSQNGYAYVQNNPLRWIDPSGYRCTAKVNGVLYTHSGGCNDGVDGSERFDGPGYTPDADDIIDAQGKIDIKFDFGTIAQGRQTAATVGGKASLRMTAKLAASGVIKADPNSQISIDYKNLKGTVKTPGGGEFAFLLNGDTVKGYKSGSLAFKQSVKDAAKAGYFELETKSSYTLSAPDAEGYVTFRSFDANIKADLSGILGISDVSATLNFNLATDYAIKAEDVGKALVEGAIIGAFGGAIMSGALGGSGILKPVYH